MHDTSSVYSVAVSSITPMYSKGVTEYSVTAFGAVPKKNDDGSVMVIEDLLDEAIVPFDSAFLNCKPLCMFEKASNCAMCREAFGENRGYWTSEHAVMPFCSWCGTMHTNEDFAYVTKDQTESYCLDCFEEVVGFLSQRDKNIIKIY